MLIFEAGRLQALGMYVGVKEEKNFPLILYMIISLASALGKIYPITSTQGKSSGRVETFVILDLIMFSYRGKYSKPASGTF